MYCHKCGVEHIDSAKFCSECGVNLTPKKEITINDYEAFIRQIIGWREYQRFIYEYLYNDIINENAFTDKRFYSGMTLGQILR